MLQNLIPVFFLLKMKEWKTIKINEMLQLQLFIFIYSCMFLGIDFVQFLSA